MTLTQFAIARSFNQLMDRPETSLTEDEVDLMELLRPIVERYEAEDGRRNRAKGAS